MNGNKTMTKADSIYNATINQQWEQQRQAGAGDESI
jgi:hypothetical protein